MVRQNSFLYINLKITVDIDVKYMIQEVFTIFGYLGRFSNKVARYVIKKLSWRVFLSQ